MLKFANLISPSHKTTAEQKVFDYLPGQSTEENYERLLPGTEEFQSPVHLPDPPQIEERDSSVAYFPEKEQDHEASGGERLSESILMRSLTIA